MVWSNNSGLFELSLKPALYIDVCMFDNRWESSSFVDAVAPTY